MLTDGPEKLGEILSRLIVQRGWGQVQQRQKLEAAWAQAAGPTLAGRTKLGTLKRGQLEVIVADAVLHHEARFAQAKLLADLTALLDNGLVKELRFRLGVV